MTDGTDTSDASDVSLSGETLKGFVGQVLMALTGFAGTLIFANLLGQDGLGAFYLLVALVELCSQPLGGLASAIKKRGSEVDGAERELMGVQGLVSLGWVAVVTTVAFLLSGRVDAYVGGKGAWWLLGATLAMEALYTTFVPILQARGRVGLAVGLDAVRSYVTFPTQVVLVVLGFGLHGMMFGLILASVVTVPLAIRHHGLLPRFPSRSVVDHTFSYARYSVPAAAVSKAYDRFDTLLLGAVLANAAPAVANYGVAVRLTLPAMFVAGTAANGLFVRVSNLHSKQEAFSQDVTNALAFASVLAVPLTFGGAAIAEPLVRTLFGGQYPGAAPFVVGLAAYRLVQSQTSILSRVIQGLDRPRIAFRISVLGLAVNVALGVALVYWVGALGVVWATIVAQTVSYVVFAVLVTRELPDVSLFPRPLVEQLVAGGVMFVAVSALHAVLTVGSWLDLSALLVAGAAVYGGVLLGISVRTRGMVLTVLGHVGLADRLPASVRGRL